MKLMRFRDLQNPEWFVECFGPWGRNMARHIHVVREATYVQH
jgi:hypothetical protein